MEMYNDITVTMTGNACEMSFLGKSFVSVSLVNTKGFACYLPRKALQVFIILHNPLPSGCPFLENNTSIPLRSMEDLGQERLLLG